LVWMLFLPRRWRIVCFFIVTPWELGIILTANYTFLNYLVVALGFLLLDDRAMLHFLPRWWKKFLLPHAGRAGPAGVSPTDNRSESQAVATRCGETPASEDGDVHWRELFRPQLAALKLSLAGVMLGWICYATTAQLVVMVLPGTPLPTAPILALEPFRIANQYGLFAVMTRGRYEIEFQGSQDGQTWVAYPFRYKPQDLSKAPGIYAPYQPRLDWNLWFASLGSWREFPIVPSTEERLLSNDPDVLALFAANPFLHGPAREVRAVLWQYWFTTMAEKQVQGHWWRRQFLGLYGPTLERGPDGRIGVVEWPTALPPRL
jgi:hypothetical protein